MTELVRVLPTDDLADLMDGSLDAMLRPGAGPYPGMHAERLTLSVAFAPHRQATLIVWPGLSGVVADRGPKKPETARNKIVPSCF